MNIVSSERANMEKRKRKPKDQRFAIEFMSPFSLEECVSRIPSGLVIKVSPQAYEFHLKSNINDKRNQFTNISGYLQRDDETSTNIRGKISTNPILYVFLAIVIPFFALLFGGMLNNLLLGGIFIFSIITFTIYTTIMEQKRVAEGMFNVFKPIPKAKEFPKRGFETWFPTLPLRMNSDLSLNSCGVRLRELAFSFATCEVVALDEQTYTFSVSGLSGYWAGVRATGIIHKEKQGTRIRCRVGIRPLTYVGLFIITSLLVIPFITGRELRVVFSPDLLVIPLIVLGASLLSVLSLRKGIEKILQP